MIVSAARLIDMGATWLACVGTALATSRPMALAQNRGPQGRAAHPAQEARRSEQPSVRDLDQGEHAPRQEITLSLRGRKIVLEYGRPALRGRTMEELLARLPANRVWRAGVNGATTLTTEGKILIGGRRLSAGRYTLYVHLAENGAWKLLVNSDQGIPLGILMPGKHPELADTLYPRPDAYSEIADKEVARIPLHRVPMTEPMEFFRITLAPARNDVSSITLTWGDQSWTAELRSAR